MISEITDIDTAIDRANGNGSQEYKEVIALVTIKRKVDILLEENERLKREKMTKQTLESRKLDLTAKKDKLEDTLNKTTSLHSCLVERIKELDYLLDIEESKKSMPLDNHYRIKHDVKEKLLHD